MTSPEKNQALQEKIDSLEYFPSRAEEKAFLELSAQMPEHMPANPKWLDITCQVYGSLYGFYLRMKWHINCHVKRHNSQIHV